MVTSKKERVFFLKTPLQLLINCRNEACIQENEITENKVVCLPEDSLKLGDRLWLSNNYLTL